MNAAAVRLGLAAGELAARVLSPEIARAGCCPTCGCILHPLRQARVARGVEEPAVKAKARKEVVLDVAAGDYSIR